MVFVWMGVRQLAYGSRISYMNDWGEGPGGSGRVTIERDVSHKAQMEGLCDYGE